MRNYDPAPPLTPGLLAGLLLRPLPDRLIDQALGLAMRQIQDSYPGMLDRLPATSGGKVIISIIDMQLDLTLNLDADPVQLRMSDDVDRQSAVAGISGPVQVLIDLLEGRVDGDALFFSRDLRFEGDTEIVVALRNALDGIDISIADLLPVPSLFPAARPRLAKLLANLHQTATRDLELIRAAATAGLDRTARQQKKKLLALEERVAELESGIARSKARQDKSKTKGMI
jgi:O2-independent ubiquinone biosynthesis accessory factor UbiT